MVEFEDKELKGATLDELICALHGIRACDGFDGDSSIEVIDGNIYVGKFGEKDSVVIVIDELRVYDWFKVQTENLAKSMEKAKRRADVIASGVQNIRKCVECGADITHLINESDKMCEECVGFRN